ncbi:MAG: hypothetical protein AB1651_01245 [Pseudomonadota bacterium]
MLRIYDDACLQRRTRLRRIQMLALFGGGVALGAWLSASGTLELLPVATAAKPVFAAPAAGRWCGATTPQARLKLDCSLALPELPRAADL